VVRDFENDTIAMSASTKTPNRKALLLATAFVVVLVLSLIVVIAEMAARYLDARPENPDPIAHVRNPQLGWLPKPGQYRDISKEFNVSVSINSLNMNDREFTDDDFKAPNRILVLGDSHTFAVGAATEDTWPKQLEQRLFPDHRSGVVFNAAVVGYSVGQYLQRFRGLKDKIRPTLVIVGFSMATDLYDLIPPERGGFIYGGNAERIYFDLGPNGTLLEKSFVSTKVKKVGDGLNWSQAIRNFLGDFALYRRLKRSEIAMWIAVHFRPGGESLWPGLDTALKKTLTESDEYRWLLAERVLGQFVQEAKALEAPVAIVIIPYLAQVYDATWAASFGTRSEMYDRWIASERMQELCKRIEATCIDTTKDFVTATRQSGLWLHWPQDAHPTAEGHALIAGLVAAELTKNGLIVARPPGSENH
jgi:lysophospholipase L1-like esterase